MNLKILITIIFTLLKPYKTSVSRSCKTQILRSLGYSSLITPSRLNSICPLVKQNCCTDADQMHIHKNFSEHTKKQLVSHYNTSIDKFKLLKRFYIYKTEYNLTDWTIQMFQKSKRRFPKKLKKHLLKIARQYDMYDQGYFLDLIKDQTEKYLEPMYAQMSHFKKTMPCLACDWNVQNSINLETTTITYKSSFCLTLVDKYLEPIAEKYEKIVKNLLVLDEWVFIVSGRRLMEEKEDRDVLRRIILIVGKCKKSAQIKFCDDFCREFNFNKFSYMFDGEQTVWEEYVNNFANFFQDYTHSQKKVWKKNKKKLGSFKKFFNGSVFSEKIFVDPYMKDYNGQALNINFETKPNDFFIDRHNKGRHNLQLQTLDNELDSLTLFKLNDDPIDLSKFLILFDDVRGIDFFKESKRNNIELPTQTILALIHSKGSDDNSLNEHIEKDVKKIISSVKIDKVADWVGDYNMDFKNMKIVLKGKSEAVKQFKSGGFKKLSNALFGWM